MLECFISPVHCMVKIVSFFPSLCELADFHLGNDGDLRNSNVTDEGVQISPKQETTKLSRSTLLEEEGKMKEDQEFIA
jgi:hypothetical protein